MKPETLIVKRSSTSAPSVACNCDPSSASVNSKGYLTFNVFLRPLRSLREIKIILYNPYYRVDKLYYQQEPKQDFKQIFPIRYFRSIAPGTLSQISFP